MKDLVLQKIFWHIRWICTAIGIINSLYFLTCFSTYHLGIFLGISFFLAFLYLLLYQMEQFFECKYNCKLQKKQKDKE